jgi:serine/threonine protein kinase
MQAIRKKIKSVSTADEDRSWSFAPGDEIVPGFHAWSLLGDGRRCETWLALSVQLWTPVAIKLPRPGCINERTYQALKREANTVASLVHPAIQRLLAAHCEEPLPYLVFEYIEGPTLAELLDERSRLAPPDVIRLGMQIASALHYIHGRGIVHCDIKPTNLALRDGRAVLIDFDIARKIGEGGAEMKARGSAQYMAPEQILGASATPAMDIFALGATLYEAITDIVVFDSGDNEPRLTYPQLTRSPASLLSIDPCIPRKLDHAVAALLEPDPQRRPPTAMAALSLFAGALPKNEQGLWPRWASKLMPERSPGFCGGAVNTPKKIQHGVHHPDLSR